MTFIEILAEMCECYITKEFTEETKGDEENDKRNNNK